MATAARDLAGRWDWNRELDRLPTEAMLASTVPLPGRNLVADRPII